MFGFAIVLCLPLSTAAQFVKQVDEAGHVTYRNDPRYDYSADQPTATELEQHRHEQAQIDEFLNSRKRSQQPEVRKPMMEYRSGASPCTKRMTYKDIRHNCAR